MDVDGGGRKRKGPEDSQERRPGKIAATLQASLAGGADYKNRVGRRSRKRLKAKGRETAEKKTPLGDLVIL